MPAKMLFAIPLLLFVLVPFARAYHLVATEYDLDEYGMILQPKTSILKLAFRDPIAFSTVVFPFGCQQKWNTLYYYDERNDEEERTVKIRRRLLTGLLSPLRIFFPGDETLGRLKLHSDLHVLKGAFPLDVSCSYKFRILLNAVDIRTDRLHLNERRRKVKAR